MNPSINLGRDLSGGGVKSHRIKNGFRRICHSGLDPESSILDSRFRGNDRKDEKFFDKIISLENLFSAWREFRRGKRNKGQNLKLRLHSDKIQIRKYRQGIDSLGYVVLPRCRVLRTKTKKRIFKKVKGKRADLETGLISEVSFNQILQSYLGVLKHCAGYKIEKKIRKICLNFATCDIPKLS